MSAAINSSTEPPDSNRMERLFPLPWASAVLPPRWPEELAGFRRMLPVSSCGEAGELLSPPSAGICSIAPSGGAGEELSLSEAAASPTAAVSGVAMLSGWARVVPVEEDGSFSPLFRRQSWTPCH